jgi:hypothetical protein
MKAKKHKPLTSQRTGKKRKTSTRRQRTTTTVTRTKTKKKPARTPVRAKTKAKSAKKIAPKAKIIPLRQYYITVSGEKISLDNELIRKYNLKAGDPLPFSGHKIFVEK